MYRLISSGIVGPKLSSRKNLNFVELLPQNFMKLMKIPGGGVSGCQGHPFKFSNTDIEIR